MYPKEYALWLGIEHMWSEGGPIEQKKWPENPERTWFLSQTALAEAWQKLSDFLVDKY